MYQFKWNVTYTDKFNDKPDINLHPTQCLSLLPHTNFLPLLDWEENKLFNSKVKHIVLTHFLEIYSTK